MTDRADIAVLILAGGDGSRIGGGKPMRLLGGRTLLDCAVDQARQWSDCVAIAARERDQVGATGCEVLVDPPAIGGPLAGLASADKLGRELVLSVPCDMPFLPPDLASRLGEALREHGAALASSDGRVHPVCGLWRAARLGELADYLASGRRSVIGFAERVGYAAVEWDEGAFVNINTPADLAKAEARIASER